MSERAPADRRAAYPYFARITTRWLDNDAYAHVNNVVYYPFFDTAVNELLIKSGVLDIRRSPIIGFVVETQCRFFTPLAFPDRIDAGVRVARITTRWLDNDAYAHVNNVVYYSFFDTAVNELLISRGVLDIRRSPVIGFVVETRCQFFAPLAFPDRIDVGIRVARVGSSSVRYEIGIFRNDDEMAAAQGHFVHVYVDRASNRPVPALPEALREVLRPLLVAG